MEDLLVFYADAPFLLDVCIQVKVASIEDALSKLSVFASNGYRIKSAYHRMNRQGNNYSCRINLK